MVCRFSHRKRRAVRQFVRQQTPEFAANLAAARELASEGELAFLLEHGRRGAPDRVTLRALGSFTAMCECPPFAVAFAGKDAGSSYVIAVPSDGVPDITTTRTALEFRLQGYFSGATIDTYEHFRAVGKDPPTPDEEQRATWPDTYPEFLFGSMVFLGSKMDQ
ncbi:MAG: hypothetical protein HOW73_22590 [Polyangiaceae bacterium]|nr:hypothetical protein [Polyangiaceae bacterium]